MTGEAAFRVLTAVVGFSAAWMGVVVMRDCRTTTASPFPLRRIDGVEMTGRLVARRDAAARTGVAAGTALAGLSLFRVGGFADARVQAGFTASLTLLVMGVFLAESLLNRQRAAQQCAFLAAGLLALHALLGTMGLTAGTPCRVLAVIAVAQMYLVTAWRKYRSRQFRSGEVLLDLVAFVSLQGSTRNPDFMRLVPPTLLARLIREGRVQGWCAVLSKLTIAVEGTLAAGVLGLLPPLAVLPLACGTHVCFALVSPRRLVPFSACTVGMVLVAVSR